MELDAFNLPIEKQFMRRMIKRDTWILNGFLEDYAAPHPHVVVGSERAAIIDTTDLPYDVRKYVGKVITDKPLITISTHSHFDHTKNNYLFEDCPQYMGQQCWEEIQENRIASPDITPGNYVPEIVGDYDIIDLGDREIECISFCGCHSKSSMVYLDIKYGCLFTGDEFEGGQVLLLSDGASVELYRNNLIALKKRLNGRVTCICPPHNGSPLDTLSLDYMIENCECVMSGIEGIRRSGL